MSSINTQEILHFQKDSAHWWDENGPFAPLHKVNPTRLSFMRETICSHFDLDESDLKAYKGLSFIDIGCGGGLLCEPFARSGGNVAGLDADKQAISVAKHHAKEQGLDIIYENKAVEELVNTNKTYDVVSALEIIEHVDNPDVFLKNCLKLVKPNGLIFISTLNKTPSSFLFGKIAAEYILNFVPQGTHDWQKFIKPSEIQRLLSKNQFSIKSIKGIKYNILKEEFKLDYKDLKINYILCASQK